MAKEKFEIVKEAVISNNCPECYNQEMSLKFLQRHLYSRLYHRTTSEVRHEIKCTKCLSIIYPVKWTEDIERSFEYYQKTVNPSAAGIKFTALFYGILSGMLLIAAGLYYFYSQGFI